VSELIEVRIVNGTSGPLPRTIREVAGRLIHEIGAAAMVAKDRTPGLDPAAVIRLGPRRGDSLVTRLTAITDGTEGAIRMILDAWNATAKPPIRVEPGTDLTIRVEVRNAFRPAQAEVRDASGKVVARAESYVLTEAAVLNALFVARGMSGHGAIRDLVEKIATPEAERIGRSETHARALGRLCADNGSGCCNGCGVELSICRVCDHVGYHASNCPENEVRDVG
jgi:hypothetical protein